jgi:hypothetical protein
MNNGILIALLGMGVPRQSLRYLLAIRFRGATCSKEADGSFMPRFRNPHNNDWPTVVIEAGLSESIRRLRTDARWWFANSRAGVQIVILVKIERPTRRLVIEKHCQPTQVGLPEPTQIPPTRQF